jgi:ectoine hydroxylase-related dioxygenase (phytanoyl-CoA dioxygenase family)
MIIITNLKNHLEINKNLLSLIEKIPNNVLKDDHENIVHTDWSLPKDQKREYVDYFYSCIFEHMNELSNKLHSKNWEIRNVWFQQYTHNNFMNWHNHRDTNFTNVYFVELPSKFLGTEILNHDKLDLNEGDLLTFPGYLYHRSPVNLSNKRKTIIAFNCDFYNYNQ